MKSEQLSFLGPIKQQTKTGKCIGSCIEYDATICRRCCCRKCKYSVEIYPIIGAEECKTIGDKACFNCDECFYYGMDNDNLRRDAVKFQCDKFEMSNFYAELEAKRKRESFKIV